MTVPKVTGHVVFDVIGIVCALLVIVLIGWATVVGAGLIVDWRRSLKSTRPIGEPAPATSEPAPVEQKRRRSPFAPKQKEGAK